jgi:hypothetical protein
VQRQVEPEAATTKQGRRKVPSSDGGGEDEDEEMESDFEEEVVERAPAKQLGEAIGGRGIAQRLRGNCSLAKFECSYD